MAATVFIDGIACLFDLSLIANRATESEGSLLPDGCSLFTDLRVRVPFLIVMLLLLGAMLCAGRIAKKEFGWRIFKMCGTCPHPRPAPAPTPAPTRPQALSPPLPPPSLPLPLHPPQVRHQARDAPCLRDHLLAFRMAQARLRSHHGKL